jgi:PadR family transcriptional regulator AphA
LLPGEYLVLALLAIRDMHGYDMVSYVAESGLDTVCPVEQSTLYTYLRNVESRGFVSWSEERVGHRPPRKTYGLTGPGRDRIDTWLRTPVDRMREVRLEFLLKLYFLRVVDSASHDRLLSEQIAACRTYLEHLDEGPNATDFARLVGRSKRSAAEATLGWLKDYSEELAVGTRAT